ncbi:hypothetical protein NCDO763_1193 [Lactococcus cremoris]|nr:hypothetical protein N41_2580 [Lactococcus cremoris]KZK51729.1 hypothetical protein NCDO763_1193 [Lactococcus cremoris]
MLVFSPEVTNEVSKKSLEQLLSANSHFSLLQVVILLILLAKILSVKIKVTDRNLVSNFFILHKYQHL